MRRIDLTGRVFGRWTVLAYAGRTKTTFWLCRCACGVERAVSGPNMLLGMSKSCGCLRTELGKTLVLRRNPVRYGDENYSVIAAKIKHGVNYISSRDIWYKRAASVFHSAIKRSIPVGFPSAMAFAHHIRSIAPEVCPVFNQPFVERGHGFNRWSPSIDKIDPTLGYIPGNIQVISMFANKMKQDASPSELHLFATWLLAMENKKCPN